jgi:hypothetical protein
MVDDDPGMDDDEEDNDDDEDEEDSETSVQSEASKCNPCVVVVVVEHLLWLFSMVFMKVDLRLIRGVKALLSW